MGRIFDYVMWWTIALASLSIALYAAAYVMLGERVFVDQLADSFRARPWGIYPHAFFGMLALAVGPFQLSRRLRLRWPQLHRRLGRVYLLGATLTGLTGLYMAAYSHGGWITHLGFGGMALTLLLTTWRAYHSIRAGRVAAHRSWMIYSFAVLFSAVTLRLWMPLFILLYGGQFTPAYQWLAWVSWVPNLLVAAAYLHRTRSPQLALS